MTKTKIVWGKNNRTVQMSEPTLRKYFKRGRLVQSLYTGEIYIDFGNEYQNIVTKRKHLPVEFRNEELWSIQKIHFKTISQHTKKLHVIHN